MELMGSAEFTNSHGDKLKITFFKDSAGGFHVITKADRFREDREPRFIGGKVVHLKVKTFTQETTITATDSARQARIEFNLSRVMNLDPSYSNSDFQAWLRETEGEEQ